MSLFALFIEGLLSFLSPCVLPLIPLYMSYLSSDAKTVDEVGNAEYKTIKVFLMTVFFVLGISTVFLLLALSVESIKPFFEKYTEVIALLGGFIIFLFGLHETGLINISLLNVEKRFNIDLKLSNMNYFKAYLLGFFFSFAWTPCIGPMLASALIIASGETLGSLYIVVYALGLIIPFLITGLFTKVILNFIKEKRKIFKYVTVIAGIILLVYGSSMVVNNAKLIANGLHPTSETQANDNLYLPDYNFTDQYGNVVNLRDYKGKYIFLNFTTTWCGYCKEEIPAYQNFADKHDDVAAFYVLSPTSSGVSKEKILEYIKENNINITVLIDEEDIFMNYFYISGYPTLYVADDTGKYIGYISGMLGEENFESVLEKAKEY
ncbi:MAG: cytochrome c biogenesis protein CcdA [Erysipelotrichaceae bacterium]|nr:cytochrome c biogenesis protein CcdA [Erysipelotrichaceae bacterium]